MPEEFASPLIYIIDDDDGVRDSLEAYLSLKGLNVLTFASGRDLLDGRVGEPQVLIIDINMPDLDGFALLECLRLEGLLAPAIFMTGLGEAEVRARAFEAGVEDFHDKPVDPKALLASVLRLVG
jgi:FixJ family two-component response regulator